MLAAGGSFAAAAADTSGPQLKIAGPARGAIVASPTQIRVIASDVSNVRKVTFAIDGVVKDIDTGGDYRYKLDPRKLRPGSHRLTVTALDRVGNARTASRTFRVGGMRNGRVAAADTKGPVISMSGPANYSTLSGYHKITANVTDASGIRDVRFYLDGALRKTDTYKPYDWYFNWSSVSAGSHVMKVVARDKKGYISTTSRTYSVGTAAPSDTLAPTLSLTAPADGSVLSAPADIAASASDASGVASVKFLVDGVVRVTDTAAPYTFTFDPAAYSVGEHVMVAIATDTKGNASQASRTYVVPAADDASGPSLTFSGPAAGSSLTGEVSISGVASDASGVREVRFFLDGALMHTELSTPYVWDYDWSPVLAGTHAVRIDAIDTLDNVSSVTRSYVVPTTTSTPPPPPPSGGTSDAQFQSHWQWLGGTGAITALGPWDAIQQQASDRIVAVTSPRQGMAPYSLRVTVKPGDYVGGGNRAEFWDGGGNAGTEQEGTDKFYSFATMFPTGFDSGKWTLFHQLHGGSGRPVVAFQGENGKMVAAMRGGDASSPNERAFTIAPSITKDVWHNFVYRVRWYADSRGILEIWHRIPSQSGTWTKVLSETGPVGYKSGGTWDAPYPKLGLYRDPSITWNTTVYQGGLHMRASTFNEAVKLFG